jgi:hypothetical protein
MIGRFQLRSRFVAFLATERRIEGARRLNESLDDVEKLAYNSDSGIRCQKWSTLMPSPLDDLQRERSKLQLALSQMDDLRPGSLVDRFRRCGKPTCHCAKPDSPGHGPSYSLTREVGGKTVTKIIPPSAVEQTKRQIDEYKRFRELTREFVEVSEKVCDAQLHPAVGSVSREVKKNGTR